MKVKVTSFYQFFPLKEAALNGFQEQLFAEGKRIGIKGLLIIGKEGCNGTICGLPEDLENYKQFISQTLGTSSISFKDSLSPRIPFKRYKVEIREEIVTLGRKGLVPKEGDKSQHLSPKEWQDVLEKENAVILDTRNHYETFLGKFKDALTPDFDMFRDFPDYVQQCGIPKDKKVLMYCTGGIRCEKAILEMNAQGYQNVFQLDGGILKYLEEFPNANFEGECFVFDSRVALDQNLAPSKRYKLCPHCGNPGEKKILCLKCGKDCVVCESCSAKAEQKNTCSKNCAYHQNLKNEKISKQAA